MISESISNDIPPQMKILNPNALLQFCLKFERCKPQKAACHPTICDIINVSQIFNIIQPDVKFNRCESDCRSRGRKFDPGLVPYIRGD